MSCVELFAFAALVDNSRFRSIFRLGLSTGVLDRPALTVDPTATFNGPPSPTSASPPVTRANSEGARSSTSPVGRTSSPSRGNWREVCLAPSPDAETYEERLYDAYAAQD